MCWPIVKSHYFSHLSWFWQSCFFTSPCNVSYLSGFKCRVFHTFLQAAPGALILMVKTASLSTELLTITILGKVSLVASGSSSARPVGHSRTEAEAICVFLLLCPVQGGCLGKLWHFTRQHEPKLLPCAGQILSCVPWQVTVSYRKYWLRFRKTKYNL